MIGRKLAFVFLNTGQVLLVMVQDFYMVQNNKWYLNFSFLWVGQILSLLASSIVQFVLVWWLTEKTGSAIYLTMATLALFIPDIFIGPILSPIIDRCSRK